MPEHGFKLHQSNLNHSMSPLLLSVDKPIPESIKKLKTDELIIFKQKNKLIFHRLIYISPNQKIIITKGDNNFFPDSPINKSKIIGKVRQIKRQNRIISPSSIYKIQSSLYLKYLNQIVTKLHQQQINFIFLKGIPLHLYINNHIPYRIYADNDLLIHRSDFAKVEKIFTNLGFYPAETTHSTQINFIKDTHPFPIVIDLHLEPAISFTKITSLAKLTPTTKLTKYLFHHLQTFTYQNISYPILDNETLLFYLLLHLFHHNFRGYHRFQLIHNLIIRKPINWQKFQQLTLKLNYQSIIYPGLKLIQKLYLPNLSLPYLKPSIASRLSTLYLLHLPPTYFFITQTRFQAAHQRLLFTLLLAPSSISYKIKQLFSPTTLKNIFTTYSTTKP